MSMNTATTATAAGSEDGFLAVAREVSMILACLLAFILSRHFLYPSKSTRRPSTCDKSQQLPRTGDRPRSASPKPEGSRERASAAVTQRAASNKSTAGPLARAAEQQILRLLAEREFTRALNIYRSCERDGRDAFFTSEDFFATFAQSAIRVGKVDVVERLLRTMRSNKLKPSPVFWQTTLKMLSARKHFSIVLAAYDIFLGELPTDKVIYSCFINAALECSAAVSAASMLAQYSEAELDPKDYILHFRTYAATSAAARAVELLEQLLTNGATTLMVNLTLLACVNAGELERAAAALETAEAHDLADVVSYNTLIKGLAQAARTRECMEYMMKMRKRGLHPDDVTWTYLVDVSAIDGDLASLARALRQATKDTDDATTYALFIRSLVRGGHSQKALELYSSLASQGGGASLDLASYALLVKAAVDAHNLELALSLTQDMKAQGHAPNDVILTHLLEGCRHVGDMELGKKLLDEFLADGVKPSEFTLVTMLKLLGRCGAHYEAHKLVECWEKMHGMKPSVIHFTCLMSGCLRSKNYDQAWQAYELLRSSGVALDRTALTILLPGLVAGQQWDRMLELCEVVQNQEPRLELPTDPVKTAIARLRTAGHSIMARRLEELAAKR